MVKHFWILAGLAVSLLVLVGVSRAADRDSLGATGVTLYEISERVTFDPDPSSAGVIRRNATSPLQGFAEVGTPLCPSDLLISVPRIQSCTIIATGTDTVSTVTGLGPVSGTFDVVINAPTNSSLHVPDLPVSAGRSTATSTCRWPASTAYSRYNRGQLHHRADGRPGHRDARPPPAVGRAAIPGD